MLGSSVGLGHRLIRPLGFVCATSGGLDSISESQARRTRARRFSPTLLLKRAELTICWKTAAVYHLLRFFSGLLPRSRHRRR